MRFLALTFLITTSALLLLPNVADAQAQNRVTILYDAFGKSSALKKDWGFAAGCGTRALKVGAKH